MKRTYDAEFFDGKCPYTGKPCYEWECNSCEVGAQVKKNMEELDKADKAESAGVGMREYYLDMTDDELIEVLKQYAMNHEGNEADLCYAASIRIAVLTARIHTNDELHG